MSDFFLMGKVKGIILSERNSGTENHNLNLFNKKKSQPNKKKRLKKYKIVLDNALKDCVSNMYTII